MRALLLVGLPLLFTGCGGSPVEPAEAEPESSVLALPITAPMKVRERLLHDLDIEKGKANDRASVLDGVISRDR